jgi:hypothetical protein
MLSGQPTHTRWILWFLALSVLCFLAAQFPEIRSKLPWFQPAPAQRG